MVEWLPWGGEAFARARVENKPVLLSIVTTWSRGCAEMDRTGYADPVVAALVSDRFVPVRVDADRRPDISSRYTLGGWPTTAFLTPDGEILGGGTFVAADRLPSCLGRAADAFAASHVRPQQAHSQRSEGLPSNTPSSVEELESLVLESFDAQTGAFGGRPLFPHTAPVHLALWHARREPACEWARVAARCLDAMGWGGLYDEIDGGFFRYANEPGWTKPQSEKLLDVNAALLTLYLDAFETLGLARYAERAADLVGYLQQTLADAQDGGWASSQREDPAYYAATDPGARAAAEPPSIDRTLYTAANATMASAALRAARVMRDDGLRAFALRSLERVLLRHYRPGAGVAHCIEGEEEVRGLLDDQIAAAGALLDAFDATGDAPYEMMAEELVRQTAMACRDTTSGGFLDRTSDGADVGLLQQPIRPFAGNCEAARVLSRLALTAGEREFAALADEALEAAAGQAPAQGALAAHYVLAMREARAE